MLCAMSVPCGVLLIVYRLRRIRFNVARWPKDAQIVGKEVCLRDDLCRNVPTVGNLNAIKKQVAVIVPVGLNVPFLGIGHFNVVDVAGQCTVRGQANRGLLSIRDFAQNNVGDCLIPIVLIAKAKYSAVIFVQVFYSMRSSML